MRWSQMSQNAVDNALYFAKRDRWREVNPGHVFAGLLSANFSAAMLNLLGKPELKVPDIFAAMDNSAAYAGDKIDHRQPGDLPWALAAVGINKDAEAAAVRFGNNAVEPVHLLLAICGRVSDDAPFRELWVTLGLDHGAILRKVLRFFGQESLEDDADDDLELTLTEDEEDLPEHDAPQVILRMLKDCFHDCEESTLVQALNEERARTCLELLRTIRIPNDDIFSVLGQLELLRNPISRDLEVTIEVLKKQLP